MHLTWYILQNHQYVRDCFTRTKNIIQLYKYVHFQFVRLSRYCESEEWSANQLTTKVRILQPL